MRVRLYRKTRWILLTLTVCYSLALVYLPDEPPSHFDEVLFLPIAFVGLVSFGVATMSVWRPWIEVTDAGLRKGGGLRAYTYPWEELRLITITTRALLIYHTTSRGHITIPSRALAPNTRQILLGRIRELEKPNETTQARSDEPA